MGNSNNINNVNVTIKIPNSPLRVSIKSAKKSKRLTATVIVNIEPKPDIIMQVQWYRLLAPYRRSYEPYYGNSWRLIQ